jgi:outer membrane protein assembly factor BamD (BamD/ComL family)
MTDNTRAPEGKAPFEEHPLYQTAMKRLDRGDVAEAAAKLNRLAEIYPEEQQIRDQTVRIQLMAALSDTKEIPVDRARPAPFLRYALVALLILTIAIVGVAAFTAAYDRYVRIPQSMRERELFVDSLRQEGLARLNAGDTQGAQALFQDLLTAVPGDPTAQAGIEQSQKQEELDHLYTDARTYEQQGDWQSALDRLHQIEAQSPNFRDVQARIKALEKTLALETLWQAAQNSIQAGNWQDAVSQLTQIRRQMPDFRRNQVEEQLFQAYTQLARQQIGQANGDLTLLRQGLGYLTQALALRPTDQELLRERSLAQGFVSGFEAYARQDWVEAVADWEPVYTMQPDYQGGILQAPLREAYPKAAEQLIARAYGDVATLRQAIDYLDKAIAVQPDDQNLIEERLLAAEYVSGSDAAAQERWSEAVEHWASIFATHPDYQHGVLEDRLRQACANYPTSTAEFCPP